MSIVRLLLRMFFGSGKSAAPMRRGEEEELVSAAEEQKAAAEAAAERKIEEKQRKEEQALEQAENALQQVIKEQGILTTNLKQLTNLVMGMRSQLQSLLNDEALLERVIAQNKKTVELSVQVINAESREADAAGRLVSEIVDRSVKSRLMKQVDGLRGAYAGLRGMYENTAKPIISQQEAVLASARKTLSQMPGILAKLATAVREGKSAEALQQDQAMISLTKDAEQYTNQLESASMQVLTFNAKVGETDTKLVQLWEALKSDYETAKKPKAA
jgi:hypothetical protein